MRNRKPDKKIAILLIAIFVMSMCGCQGKGQNERIDNSMEDAEKTSEGNTILEGDPNEKIYQEVLAAYEHAIEWEDISDRIINEYAVRYCLYVGNAKIGYTFYDINEDEMPELLIGLNRKGEFELCDIFSYDGTTVVDIFENLKGSSEEEFLEDEGLCYVNICESGYLEGRFLSTPINDEISMEDLQANYVKKDLSNETKVNIDELKWRILVKVQEPRIMTEAKMQEIVRNKFAEETGEVETWINDFNGDGKYEAFVKCDWALNDVVLYFVSDIGRKYMCAIPTDGEAEEVISEGGKKYLVWEDHSTNETKLYTVSDEGELIVVPCEEVKTTEIKTQGTQHELGNNPFEMPDVETDAFVVYKESNVYKEPSLDSNIIGTVTVGQYLYICSIDDQWTEVLFNDIYAYVPTSAFEPQGNMPQASQSEKKNNLSEGNINSAFYGVWVGAAKDQNSAVKMADQFEKNGISIDIYVTTDWENLNTKKYYVLTAGTYFSKEDAEAELQVVKNSGYKDAYVKYSGEHK